MSADIPEDQQGPAPLSWSGISRLIPIPADQAGAMDVALALAPTLRLAALAIVRAREAQTSFPVTDPSFIDQLVTVKEIQAAAGGDEEGIGKYIAAEELPIEHEGELANSVYLALNRRIEHLRIRQRLAEVDEALLKNTNGNKEA